ncbi:MULTISPECIES: nuclear transport factor 2 family protein [Kordiimonas]|jgi:ketosteroid isomerase-like protein|uniref:nuclear transport factor 2 family protein n=1 Tax=Kordiimonas TaxID=288021 RepID=UPI00257A8AD4|nr:nuclear transport factor 2 family protein [Kordiimonas sp. UBA4487]
MRTLIVYFILIFGFMMPVLADDEDLAGVNRTLDTFHGAASDADWDTYFALLTEDSIFLGTDASERWDKPTFQAYALPTKGWTYTVRERHVNFTPDGNTAWFDELLDNTKYGTSRGTGVLIRTNDGWKISQYHLTFPLPNDLAKGITEQIQAFEAGQKAGQQ